MVRCAAEESFLTQRTLKDAGEDRTSDKQGCGRGSTLGGGWPMLKEKGALLAQREQWNR